MAIYLNSNAASLNALRHITKTTLQLNTSMERLSSGYKVNRAGDGPASLMISETLRAQIRGFDAATSNVQQGLNMVQTADSALQQINDSLQRIREIAVSASNGTTTTAQFAAYSDQITAEINTINQIANNTRWGTNVGLLSGSNAGAAFNIQIGANSGDTLDISTAFATSTATGLGGITGTIASVGEATSLLGQVDTAIANVNDNLATIGGFENQLTNQLNYLSIAKENFTASEAQIRNTDVAAETATLARLQILQQAGVYAMSQANSMPSVALRLLQ